MVKLVSLIKALTRHQMKIGIGNPDEATAGQ